MSLIIANGPPQLAASLIFIWDELLDECPLLAQSRHP